VKVQVQKKQPEARWAIKLNLLGEFALTIGSERVDVPVGSQRVIALVALSDTPLTRGRVCGTLWSDAEESRAAARLRTAIWRASRGGRCVLSSFQNRLALADNVVSDVATAAAVAARICEYPEYIPDGAEQALLCGELLPCWDEEWLVAPRERIRNLHAHALERLCNALARRGSYDRAIDAGLAAVQADPLWDKAHAALVRAYIAGGNRGRAIRHFLAYAAMLDAELDLRPDPEVEDLVAPIVSGRALAGRRRQAAPWPRGGAGTSAGARVTAG
jgi:DNA-binding SARP family transcriptional activator